MYFIASIFLSLMVLNTPVMGNDSIKMKSIPGVLVNFENGIHFDIGESKLNNVTKEELSKLAEALIKNPNQGISIVGHTDSTGTIDLNQSLSENRAKAVAEFLISKNVSAKQLIEISGKNFSEPVADNSTAEGRAENRHADVYIVSSPLAISTVVKNKTTKNQPANATLKKLLDQVLQQSVKTNDNEIEIDGLLVDDTRTKAGKDFYDLFYSSWEAPAAAKNYTITVSEKPFRFISTLITISINDNQVYQAILQPRLDILEEQTKDAIAMTQDYLANYEEIIKQLNGDDLSGSGIY